MKPSPTDLNPAVSIEDLSVTLGGVSILQSVTAHVPLNSNTAIVGPNGAGKTTLLLALLGQVPYAGRIRFGCASNGDRPRIGYVPQRLALDRGMPLTVLEFLSMGGQRSPVWFGVGRAHRDRAREMLSAVGEEQLAQRRIGALSGGELQRVLLALALQQEPELLVLDEPAAGVDEQGGHIVCGLLDTLRKERGFTQFMVSHDLSMVMAHATHVICLNRRVTGEGVPCEVLTAGILTETFGLHMGIIDARTLGAEQFPCSTVCPREDQHD